jgi:ferrochelatase
MVSFGGPEGPEDVMPFLENVLRGKNVPRERMLEVAEHYSHFGGISPINAQCRALIDAIQDELDRRGIALPIYWGNRNWHPMLTDTLSQMKSDGRKRAIAFFTTMFSCYSGCRQYRENIAAAINLVGQEAPLVEKARMGFNHPKFIEAHSDCVRQTLDRIDPEHLTATTVLFSAHSAHPCLISFEATAHSTQDSDPQPSSVICHLLSVSCHLPLWCPPI